MTTWTKDTIKAELQKGNKPLLVRALLAIYEGQTSHEKLTMTTHEDNGIGFNGADAEILTSFVEQWRTRQWLSEKQYALLQKKMPKYSGQLARIAEEKAKAKEPKVEPKTFVIELSEAEFTVGGFVKFEDGMQFDIDDMEHIFQEGEVVSWEAIVDGTKYVIIND